MLHCKTCSLWRPQSDFIGICQRVHLDVSSYPQAPCIVPVLVRGAVIPSLDFATRPDFGCTEHQPNGRAEATEQA